MDLTTICSHDFEQIDYIFSVLKWQSVFFIFAVVLNIFREVFLGVVMLCLNTYCIYVKITKRRSYINVQSALCLDKANFYHNFRELT